MLAVVITIVTVGLLATVTPSAEAGAVVYQRAEGRVSENGESMTASAVIFLSVCDRVMHRQTVALHPVSSRFRERIDPFLPLCVLVPFLWLLAHDQEKNGKSWEGVSNRIFANPTAFPFSLPNNLAFSQNVTEPIALFPVL